MTKKKLLILTILMVILLQIILPLKSLAATYDRITINVRVYDQSTGNSYEIAKDYVSKGNNNYIQSMPYQIPRLSEFVDSSLYDKVTKVVGNWYFPTHDSAEGATVEWSTNAGTKTMTYWVTSYKKPGGSTGSDTTDTESIGSGTKTPWTTKIVYHSNYPDGNDYTKSITYTLYPYTASGDINGNLKKLEDCDFKVPEGFRAQDRVWNTEKTGNGTSYASGGNYYFQKAQRGVLHLYAQWEITYSLDYKTTDYNVKNMPESTSKTTNTSTETFNITTQEPSRDLYSFQGWSTQPRAMYATYNAEDEIQLNSYSTRRTLYPVWEELPEISEEKDTYSYYNIEYYYDNVKDTSKNEKIANLVGNEVTQNMLNEKIQYNTKSNYQYVSTVGAPLTIKKGENPTIKIFYESIEKEEPLDPNDPNKLFTITIENNKAGHKYNSYQVFAGNYYEETDEEGNKKAILSNIEWGTELNKVIATDVEEDAGKTHGDKIIEALKASDAEKYKDCITAADVADVLSQYPEHDNEVIRNFVNVVGKYIKDNNITITKDTTEFLEYADSTTGTITNTYYQIRDLEPGYYIVIDAETSEKDDSFSRYLIDVVQDVTMHVKTSIPTLTKTVGENNIEKEIETTAIDETTGEERTVKSTIKDNTHNTATYKANGNYDINFQLNTTIPDTDTYEEYKFVITDTIAKGFDFDASSLVITISGTEYKDYALRNNVDETTGNRILEIDFGNLVEKIANNSIQKAQDVVIKYNAKLNANAETGNTPNINEAYLTYSNHPYDTSKTTQTTTVNTYTYSIKLDISKIAEKENVIPDEGGEIPEEVLTYLGGAEFEIYDGPEYIVDESGKRQKNTSRSLIATITSSSEEANKGHAVYNSLGAGTYYIKESKSPNGYNKLKEEIEIEILATYDGFGIGWGVNDKSSNILVKAIPKTEDGIEGKIPYISLELQNTSGFQLPSTGGIGTIIFTVIGLSIMLMAGVSLKINKKK